MSNQHYSYRKLNLENLEPNKSYTFYKKDGTVFDGTFACIVGQTLVVRDYRIGNINDKSAIRTMPKDWIAYVESEEYKIKINNFIW